MYQRKRENVIRCPLEYGMELFGGKWNSHIICVLAVLGTLRYSELRREMGNITGLPDFFANKAGVLLEGGDALFVGNAAGYIRLNLAMPRSITKRALPAWQRRSGKHRLNDRAHVFPFLPPVGAAGPGFAVSVIICQNYPKIRSILHGGILRIPYKISV